MEILDLDKTFGSLEEKVKNYTTIIMDTGLVNPYFRKKDLTIHSLKSIIKEMMKGNLNGNKFYLKDYIERVSSLVNKYGICTIPEVIEECKGAIRLAREEIGEIKHIKKDNPQAKNTEITLRAYANKLEGILENIKIEDTNPPLSERGIYLPLISAALESRKYCGNKSNKLRTDELIVAKAHYLSMEGHKGILILTTDGDLPTLSRKVYEITRNRLKRCINTVSVYNIMREIKPESFLTI